MTGLGPGYLNAGLMKPRKGFTPVAGKEKLRVGIPRSLDRNEIVFIYKCLIGY